MKDIVIIGAGGFGREVLWLIEDINNHNPTWNFLGFIDDSIPSGSIIDGYQVIGNIDWLNTHNINVVCAIGDPISKRNVLSRLTNPSLTFPVLVHPTVIQSRKVILNEGTIICAGSILTVNIYLGKHVIVNLDCTIGHDAYIDDYSTILPSCNISGHVTIEKCVSIGTGTQVIQGLTIGRNSIIGAGAVVNRDIEFNSIAVGIPAKTIKKREIMEEHI